ncbi:MAG TPA: DUF445 family protein [Oscillospiraceae bacterium]|nr:DUF445 family protein [Oscillospiraceae bacterium]
MIFIFLPLTGAVIGWITNVLAIRLLFRPQKPWRLWPLPFTLQGLIPRRRTELAVNIGEIVARELFSLDELPAHLDLSQLQEEVKQFVREAVERWCEQKMGFLPQSVRNYCSQMLRERLADEVARQFPVLADSMFTHMQQQVDVRAVVIEKVNALALTEIETLVLQVAHRELKQIEWLGAVLGFIIGIFQALLTLFIGKA